MLDKRINVAKVIVSGDFDSPADSEAILEQSASMLDGCNAAEIIPENLFLGDDGTFYTVTVEAVIGEASFSLALDKIGELLDEEERCDLRMRIIRRACEYLRKACQPEEDAAFVYAHASDVKDAIDAIVPDWDTGDYEGWTIADVIALPDVQPELYQD